MNKPINIAVLGSGNGTSFQGLLKHACNKAPILSIECVISNQQNAGILTFSKQQKFKHYFIQSRNKKRHEFERQLNDTLRMYSIDLIVLAGFMRILTPEFTSKWHHKIINIHPSLLPKHKGLMDLEVHQSVINSKDTSSGCSVHYANEKVDEGEIIHQETCMVLPNDTALSLKNKVQKLEGIALYNAINKIRIELFMNQEKIMPKRALISVSDKTGLIPFAKKLDELGIEIISTGGTLQALEQEGIKVQHVSNVTDFPEIMNGRVKTLHPLLLGGVLGQRDKHENEARRYNINWIDLVICNLYPFASVIKNKESTFSQALENIDVGGPTMIRASAKNFPWVSVAVNYEDYDDILSQLNSGGLTFDFRKALARKAFEHTAHYDGLISNYLNNDEAPSTINLTYKKSDELRYGENPHQKAWIYKNESDSLSILNAKQLHGKKLSYNNLVDAQAAIDAISNINQPASVIIKHAIPCGMAYADTINQAFEKAFMSDEKSAFGGVVGLSQPCNKAIADVLSTKFVEIIIAPDFSQEALNVLKQKNNVRLLTVNLKENIASKVKKFIPGGFLLQDKDLTLPTKDSIEVVSGSIESETQLNELLFAWQVVKHVKSNAIVITKNLSSLGIGGGQVSRVDAVEIALNKAKDNCQNAVLASDAFFPFRDSIDLIAKAGIKTIIQPGGSMRDKEVIAAAKEHGICMVFTHTRAFNH